MPTVRENLVQIRDKLGNPSRKIISDSFILAEMKGELDDLLNRLNLTDENWILDKYDLTVLPGKDEYDMPPNFGRPVVIETKDDADPNFVRREIQIVDFQNFNLFWGGYKDFGGVYPFKHSAICIAVMGEANKTNRILKYAPPPQDSATYRVWFEVSYVQVPKLAENTQFMEQFHNLWRANTCLKVVAHIKRVPGITDDFFIPLRDMLVWESKRYDLTFQTYINQGFHEDTGDRHAFNSSRLSSDNDGW